MAKRRTAAQIQAVLTAIDRDRAKGWRWRTVSAARDHGAELLPVAGSGDGGRGRRDPSGAGVGDGGRAVKLLLAETMLDNQMLREVAKKKW